jgi:hypothetical protein
MYPMLWQPFSRARERAGTKPSLRILCELLRPVNPQITASHSGREILPAHPDFCHALEAGFNFNIHVMSRIDVANVHLAVVEA